LLAVSKRYGRPDSWFESRSLRQYALVRNNTNVFAGSAPEFASFPGGFDNHAARG
jgi:hypothetical protein